MKFYYLRSMIKYWRKTLKLFRDMSKHGMECSEWSEITVDELRERINSNKPPLVIDVRSTKEFNGADGHVPDARSIPVLELEAKLEDLQSFKDEEIVTICPGGGMSLVAVDILVEAGFNDAKSLRGGMDLWSENGYPITTAG